MRSLWLGWTMSSFGHTFVNIVVPKGLWNFMCAQELALQLHACDCVFSAQGHACTMTWNAKHAHTYCLPCRSTIIEPPRKIFVHMFWRTVSVQSGAVSPGLCVCCANGLEGRHYQGRLCLPIREIIPTPITNKSTDMNYMQIAEANNIVSESSKIRFIHLCDAGICIPFLTVNIF